MPTATAIHSSAQKIAGTPVALYMLTASFGTAGANGDERKKTVFRSSSAFRMHCTAIMLTMKSATRSEVHRPIAYRPSESTTPAIKVNGTLHHDCPGPEKIGLRNPKTKV